MGYCAIGPCKPCPTIMDALRLRPSRAVLSVALATALLVCAGVHRALPTTTGGVGIEEEPGIGVDVGHALRTIANDVEERFERRRALAVLADRTRREPHDRSDWTRCPARSVRPIRISRACLDNPLAKACM